MYNWTRTYLRDDRLWCVTVYDHEKLAAIAPLWVDEIRCGGLFKLRILKFLGSTEVCSDHLDLIIQKKKAPLLVTAIRDHLFGSPAGDWDVFEYHNVSCNSLILSSFSKLAAADFRCIKRVIDGYSVCPYVVLPQNWDEYVASLSINQRRALKVSTKRLSDEGNLELRFCENKAALPEEMARLIELNRRTWASRGQTGSFATREFELFHERVAECFLAQGKLFLCSLWLNKQHLGSFYGFMHDRTVYYYITGVEKNLVQRANIGRVLLAGCIRETIKRGCREFDMLRGDEQYKYDWTNLDRRNLLLTFYNRRVRTFLYILYRFARQYTKQVARALFGKKSRVVRRWMARSK
jgi:hypothetical protein